MRHLRFVLLALVALFIALPASLVWSMSECQLNPDELAIDACFSGAYRDKIVYAVTMGIGLITAVALHIRRSKWVWLGLATVAFGPWLTMWL